MPDRDGSMWQDTAIDLRYVVGLSFRSDLAILLRTVFRSRPAKKSVPEAPCEVTLSVPLPHPALIPSESEPQALTG